MQKVLSAPGCRLCEEEGVTPPQSNVSYFDQELGSLCEPHHTRVQSQRREEAAAATIVAKKAGTQGCQRRVLAILSIGGGIIAAIAAGMGWL